MRYPFLFVAALILFLSGCFTPPVQRGLPGQVPPGHVRIKGTVINILNESSDDSCLNCIAGVRVDSVEGFGLRSKVVFSGDTLKVRFIYSLDPYTDTASAEQENSLPGLNINDIFRGDIECYIEAGGRCNYQLYWYVKQSNAGTTKS